VRLVGRIHIDDFVKKHVAARRWVQTWVLEVEDAVWRSPQDIKDRYRSASFLANNVVIFNIKGNQYRLKCVIAYKTQTVVIQWVGTHAEYSKLS
jgi:mRNA interferase HigB